MNNEIKCELKWNKVKLLKYGVHYTKLYIIQVTVY